MPASMMSAGTGGRLNVIGRSIAIVASGPMPGSTPIRVPRSTPRKQNQMFCQERATLKPRMRLWKSSMPLSPVALDERVRQAQTVDEDAHADDRQPEGEEENLLPLELAARRGGKNDERRKRRDEPG